MASTFTVESGTVESGTVETGYNMQCTMAWTSLSRLSTISCYTLEAGSASLGSDSEC